MRYSYQEGVEKAKSRAWTGFASFGIFAGIYLLANALSPALLDTVTPADVTAKKLVSLQPQLSEDRIYIPKINTDVAIVPIKGDEKIALEKGAINRAPLSGNPADGGNYVVAAHRFNLGYTPTATKAKSPFYHINKLSVGDDIYVDYKGTRYAYKVEEKQSVELDAVEIEAKTQDSRLTVYTCELAGSAAGRDVVVAKPVGKIVWQGGKPLLKSL